MEIIYKVVKNNEGTFWYNQNGEYHREDGPAVEYPMGTKEWRFNGQLHRLDGPAVEWSDGSKSWWVDGKRVSELEFNLLNGIMKLKGLL